MELQKGGYISKEFAKKLRLNYTHDQELPKSIIEKLKNNGMGLKCQIYKL